MGRTYIRWMGNGNIVLVEERQGLISDHVTE